VIKREELAITAEDHRNAEAHGHMSPHRARDCLSDRDTLQIRAHTTVLRRMPFRDGPCPLRAVQDDDARYVVWQHRRNSGSSGAPLSL
jgi:hypothetical protein